MGFADCLDDDSFGPTVRGCRGDFDFTITFEKLFLSIVPSCILLIGCCGRSAYLYHHGPELREGGWLGSSKLLFHGLHVALHLPRVALGASVGQMTTLFVVSDALALLAAASMMSVSFLEHSRSPRPSVLLEISLLPLILFDITSDRTLWLAAESSVERAYAGVITAALATKSAIAVLESRNKSKWLLRPLDRRSPDETAGIISLGSFFWLNRLLVAGYHKRFSVDDLYPLDSRLMVRSGASSTSKQYPTRAELGCHQHGLAWWLAKSFMTQLLLPVGPRIALIGFKWSQPFLLYSVVRYLDRQSDRDPPPSAYKYGLLGAFILVYGGLAATTALYWHLHERTICFVRAKLLSSMYASLLEKPVSSEYINDSAGLTMMTADVERIRVGLLQLHEFWGTSIEAILACLLLGLQLGAAAVAPVVLVAACVLVSIGLSSVTAKRQGRWMAAVQTRIGLTARLVSNVKYLKISGLASTIVALVQRMRLEEIAKCGQYRQMQLVGIVLAFLPATMSPVLTLAFTSQRLDSQALFSTVSYFLLLTAPLSQLFQAVPSLLGAFACLKRIQSFLEEPPREDGRENIHLLSPQRRPPAGDGPKIGQTPAVRIEKGSFGWLNGSPVLTGVDLTIPSSCLTILTGPAASGKSTLCKAILGEVPYTQGRILLGTRSNVIALCEQAPFLQRGTIRENIVGFSRFDEMRYAEVIESAMLSQDFSTLALGDQTVIGSNAVNLSGGQKQRISLARALYRESDLLIVDDTLSGLDKKTEEQVAHRVFGPEGLLAKRGTTAILCTHSARPMLYAGFVVAVDGNGAIVAAENPAEIRSSNLWRDRLKLTPQDELTYHEGHHSAIMGPEERGASPADMHDQSGVSRAPPKRNWPAYKYYVENVGAVPLTLFILVGLTGGFFGSFHTVWLSFWSDDLTPQPSHSKPYWLGTYAAFRLAYLVCIFALSLLAVRQMIMLPGAALHKTVLRTAMGAPVRFFTKAETGTITSLLSQDMTMIDGELPVGILLFTADFCLAVGLAFVIPTSSVYLLIAYPVLLLVLWAVQTLYLRTARQLRILDLELKGPLHSHFLATSQGLATVRAFDWTREKLAINDQLLNTSQRPAYLLAMTQRWLHFAMYMVVAGIAVVLVLLSTHLKSSAGLIGASLMTLMTFGETLAGVVRNVAQVDICIGAVARIHSFTKNTPQEPEAESEEEPPAMWPTRGQITVDAVSAAYDNAHTETAPANPALQDFSLTVEAGERTIVCGRTGSGKSSLILLLLRLLDPLPGCSARVTVDGIRLQEVSPSVVRERIIAIPQELPFFIETLTVKENLDPAGVSSHAECRTVFQTLGLWKAIESLGGLDAKARNDAFSQGQALLFGVGRAIIRHRGRVRTAQSAMGHGNIPEERKASSPCRIGGVLLVDEVSSGVDVATERLIVSVLGAEFVGYTIIIVSHRLQELLHFDKAIVMDEGRLVESGRPVELIRDHGSIFRELWLLGRPSETSHTK